MSTYYYIFKKSSKEYICVGTGSYRDYHEDLFDNLMACKKNNAPLDIVKKETLRIYSDYSDDPEISDDILYHSWYTTKFIPAVYNWLDSSCVLASEYDLCQYAEDYLISQAKTELEKDEIKHSDYIIDKVLKEVGSIWEEDNDSDSIIDKCLSFPVALNELLSGKTIYRKSVLPEVDYFLDNGSLCWIYTDDEKKVKHPMNVVGTDLLLTNDWLVK